MNVLVRGSSGLIGSALISALANEGHRVIRLTRSGSAGDHGTVRWDPSASEIDTDRLEGIDAVVHLAGESVEGRWTSAKKARIRKSRVQGTPLLAETLAGLPVPPGVMVSASATGYYGDRGDKLLREESAPGSNFLARTCQEWEVAADPARGVRVAHPRFGLVLSAEGGALATMLPIFKLDGGGKIGSGRLRYFLYFMNNDTGQPLKRLLLFEALRLYISAYCPYALWRPRLRGTSWKSLLIQTERICRESGA